MSSCLQTFTHFLPSGGETEKCDGKKKKVHYPSEKVGLFWNLLVTAVRRHFYFEGEHSVLFWVTFLQVSLQFSHCQQPKQLQDGFCRKTLTAWGPRPFSKRLLGVAGSVVKTFIVPYRNFFKCSCKDHLHGKHHQQVAILPAVCQFVCKQK